MKLNVDCWRAGWASWTKASCESIGERLLCLSHFEMDPEWRYFSGRTIFATEAVTVGGYIKQAD